jgi:hypothetical protein
LRGCSSVSSSACFTAIPSKEGRSPAQLENGRVQLPDHEVQQYNVSKDCAVRPSDTVKLKDCDVRTGDTVERNDCDVKPGDTVEIKDKSERNSNANHSGDSLHVRQRDQAHWREYLASSSGLSQIACQILTRLRSSSLERTFGFLFSS